MGGLLPAVFAWLGVGPGPRQGQARLELPPLTKVTHFPDSTSEKSAGPDLPLSFGSGTPVGGRHLAPGRESVRLSQEEGPLSLGLSF